MFTVPVHKYADILKIRTSFLISKKNLKIYRGRLTSQVPGGGEGAEGGANMNI